MSTANLDSPTQREPRAKGGLTSSSPAGTPNGYNAPRSSSAR